MNYSEEDLLLNLLYSDEMLHYLNNNHNNVRTVQLTFPSYLTQNRRIRSVQDVIEETMNVKPVFKYVISEEGKKLLKEEVYDISNNNGETNTNMCPISLVEFENNEKLIRLPCNHLFNKENILNWLEKEKSECPVCRHQLPSNEVRNEDNLNQNQGQDEYQTQALNQNNNEEYNENESYEGEVDNDDELFDFIDTYEQRQILLNRLTLLDRLIGHQF